MLNERADESIEDEIWHALTHDRDLDASDIDIDVKDGDVWLLGFIDNRFERRLAEEIVGKIRGVRKVTNALAFKEFGFQVKKHQNEQEQGTAGGA